MSKTTKKSSVKKKSSNTSSKSSAQASSVSSLMKMVISNKLAVFILLFAVVGAFLVIRSFAAPAPETGTLTGPLNGVSQLDQPISFNATWSKNVKGPRMVITCYQNGQVVYGELMDFSFGGNSKPGITSSTFTYVLAGGSSIWSYQTYAQSADCIAALYDYGINANGPIVKLAQVNFTGLPK